MLWSTDHNTNAGGQTKSSSHHELCHKPSFASSSKMLRMHYVVLQNDIFKFIIYYTMDLKLFTIKIFIDGLYESVDSKVYVSQVVLWCPLGAQLAVSMLTESTLIICLGWIRNLQRFPLPTINSPWFNQGNYQLSENQDIGAGGDEPMREKAFVSERETWREAKKQRFALWDMHCLVWQIRITAHQSLYPIHGVLCTPLIRSIYFFI